MLPYRYNTCDFHIPDLEIHMHLVIFSFLLLNIKIAILFKTKSDRAACQISWVFFSFFFYSKRNNQMFFYRLSITWMQFLKGCLKWYECDRGQHPSQEKMLQLFEHSGNKCCLHLSMCQILFKIPEIKQRSWYSCHS